MPRISLIRTLAAAVGVAAVLQVASNGAPQWVETAPALAASASPADSPHGASLAMERSYAVAARTPKPRPSDESTPAPASVLKAIRSVPAATLNLVGPGALAAGIEIERLSGKAVKRGTKAVLFSDDEAWCPDCEANSWALAITLSRFGKLSGVRVINSGTYYGVVLHHNPSYPNTQGLSFIDAHYKSKYLIFAAVVRSDRQDRSIEQLTPAETQAVGSFDPRHIVPVVDLGGAYATLGALFSPALLAGLSSAAIAGELANPTSALAPYIDAEANLLTAGLCVATGGRPAAVCSAPGVRASAPRLPH
ncbi:MAG TPA: DUF929 family protein [Solirubrobacteraceae bacterium]|nr:DUF929 family protein [Solirubrobacteraceae bacterium]